MEINRQLYEKVAKTTGWNYEPIYQKEAEAPVIITSPIMENILEDLLLEISERDEKIEDILKDREDNYKRITVEEQIGGYQWK